MLQRDYIMRLIAEFFKTLERLLHKREPEKRREALEDMYRQYVGDYSFFHTADIDSIMHEMERFAADERIYRLEMLAELLYVDADLSPYPFNQDLLQKALILFRYIDANGRTYSLQRLQKIADIEKRLSAAERPS